MEDVRNGPSKKREGDEITVSFDSTIYEKESLLAAAYTLTGSYTVSICENEGKYLVTIRPSFDGVSPLSDEKIGHLINDTLDEQLRLHLERRSGQLRDIIVQHAFSPINIYEAVGNKDIRQ